MAQGGVNGKSIAVTLAGAILAYSGVKGKRISVTVRDLLAGKNPSSDNTTDLPITSADAASQASLNKLLIPPTDNSGQPPVVAGAPGTTAAHNQAIGKQLARAYGWDKEPYWSALLQLWTNESGWSNTARNANSGAYGIPQGIPSIHPDYALIMNTGARAQIIWGLHYIKVRYRNPVNALTFWNRTDPRPYPGHWY